MVFFQGLVALIFVLGERRSAPYEQGTRRETGGDRRRDSFFVGLRMVQGCYGKKLELI